MQGGLIKFCPVTGIHRVKMQGGTVHDGGTKRDVDGDTNPMFAKKSLNVIHTYTCTHTHAAKPTHTPANHS